MMAEKNSQLCAETKKFSTECPFWAVSAHQPLCLPIFVFSAHWTTVDHEHVLENQQNNVLDSFLGVESDFWVKKDI
jgi:aromatic ring-opening dioxygenase catalytic subunit (LigB family)